MLLWSYRDKCHDSTDEKCIEKNGKVTFHCVIIIYSFLAVVRFFFSSLGAFSLFSPRSHLILSSDLVWTRSDICHVSMGERNAVRSSDTKVCWTSQSHTDKKWYEEWNKCRDMLSFSYYCDLTEIKREIIPQRKRYKIFCQTVIISYRHLGWLHMETRQTCQPGFILQRQSCRLWQEAQKLSAMISVRIKVVILVVIWYYWRQLGLPEHFQVGYVFDFWFYLYQDDSSQD